MSSEQESKIENTEGEQATNERALHRVLTSVISALTDGEGWNIGPEKIKLFYRFWDKLVAGLYF